MNHTITDTTAVHQGQEGHLHNQEERQGGAQAPQQHTVQDRA